MSGNHSKKESGSTCGGLPPRSHAQRVGTETATVGAQRLLSNVLFQVTDEHSSWQSLTSRDTGPIMSPF